MEFFAGFLFGKTNGFKNSINTPITKPIQLLTNNLLCTER